MVYFHWLLLTAIITLGQSKIIQFYIEPEQRVMPTYVQQLVDGDLESIEQGSRLTASISLIYDGGYYIIVDSPSATDLKSKEAMLRGITSRNIVPGEIQIVVTTHGHPDHFGQGNFFPNARHFFGSYEYSDDKYITTELHTKDSMLLSKNVVLWNTPGHTEQDISVVVSNVPNWGTVAIVGDLFYNEQDAINVSTEWFDDAWNPVAGKQNRDKIICHTDYIVPGHGRIFKVTDEMKKRSACGNLDKDISDIFISHSLPDTNQFIGTSTEKISSSIPSFTLTPLMTGQQGITMSPFLTANTMMQALKRLNTPSDRLASDVLEKVNDALPHMCKSVFQKKDLEKVVQSGINELHSVSNDNSFAPIVETAASKLANLFKMDINKTIRSEHEQYPFTRFWQNTIQRLTKDAGLNRVMASPDNIEVTRLKSLTNYLRNIGSFRTQQP